MEFDAIANVEGNSSPSDPSITIECQFSFVRNRQLKLEKVPGIVIETIDEYSQTSYTPSFLLPRSAVEDHRLFEVIIHEILASLGIETVAWPYITTELLYWVDELLVVSAGASLTIQVEIQLNTEESLKSVDASTYENTHVKDETCAICLDELQDSVESIRVPCSHIFHCRCLVQWLRLSRSCPLCLREIKAWNCGRGRVAMYIVD